MCRIGVVASVLKGQSSLHTPWQHIPCRFPGIQSFSFIIPDPDVICLLFNGFHQHRSISHLNINYNLPEPFEGSGKATLFSCFASLFFTLEKKLTLFVFSKGYQSSLKPLFFANTFVLTKLALFMQLSQVIRKETP